MNNFLLNILSAFVWMLINGSYGSFEFASGFAIGYLTLWLTQPFGSKSKYFQRFGATVNLFFFFLHELIMSSLEVVWEVLTPRYLSKPDIVSVPLTAKTDLEITLLANMVSLTPGTLSLDVTPCRQYLLIHAMFVEDHEQVINSIKQGLEKKLLEVTRG